MHTPQPGLASLDAMTVQLLARVATLEFLIETLYAGALLRSVDPVGEARRWIGELDGVADRLTADVEGVDPALTRAVVGAMTRQLEAMFGRILARVESHARQHPVAGSA